MNLICPQCGANNLEDIIFYSVWIDLYDAFGITQWECKNCKYNIDN